MATSTTTSPTASPATTAPPTPAAPTVRSRIGWTFVVLSALAIVAFAAVPYATGSLDALAEQQVGLAEAYAAQPLFVQLALYLHIAGGSVALILGALQFWRGLRDRLPRVHRWTGRVYLVAVALGGAAGLLISFVSPAGWVGLFGFGTLAVLWMLTGWRAYRAIRRGDVATHQSWMIRNYALTFGAVTLRLWIPLLLLLPLWLGMPWEFESAWTNAYAAVPFLAWLPNLLVAEWLIRRRGLPSYRLTPAS